MKKDNMMTHQQTDGFLMTRWRAASSGYRRFLGEISLYTKNLPAANVVGRRLLLPLSARKKLTNFFLLAKTH